MQTFDQALFGHLKAGRVTVEDALRVASSPHDFKLLVQADGRRGTTMEDVASAQEQRGEAPAGAAPPVAPTPPSLAPAPPSGAPQQSPAPTPGSRPPLTIA